MNAPHKSKFFYYLEKSNIWLLIKSIFTFILYSCLINQLFIRSIHLYFISWLMKNDTFDFFPWHQEIWKWKFQCCKNERCRHLLYFFVIEQWAASLSSTSLVIFVNSVSRSMGQVALQVSIHNKHSPNSWATLHSYYLN